MLLNTGFGVRSDQQADIKKLWPKLTGLKWMHCASAGKLACLRPFPPATNGHTDLASEASLVFVLTSPKFSCNCMCCLKRLLLPASTIIALPGMS